MRALRGLWITLRSLLYTGYASAVFLWQHRNKEAPENDANQAINAWCQHTLSIAKATCNVHGSMPDFAPNTPCMVLCNHRSLMDIPISCYALKGKVRMLSKHELRHAPIFGRLMKKMHMVLLDRKKPKTAMQQLRAGQKKLGDIPLWCAPEGTRSTNTELLPFKKGVFMLALQTGATIVPMTIDGSEKILPKKHLLLRPHQQVNVHIGQTIDSKRYSIRTLKQLMHDTRAQMLSMLAQDLQHKTKAN